MTNKEFKVGETFQCGLVKLRVEEDNYESVTLACRKCFFGECCNAPGLRISEEIAGECLANRRTDKKYVIFVKVED